MPARLMLDGGHDEADGVDVLRLGAGAQPLARLADGDIHVRAHGAFLHVTIARADIAQDAPQLAQIGARFRWGCHIRPADNLHQRHAGAIEIDIRARRVLIMHQLAGILLNMDALDANGLGRWNAGLFIRLDSEQTFAHKRMIKLRNLVALRQIGIEIILAVEPAPFVDLRLDGHAGAHRLTDAFAVGHGQHPRHCGIDKADLAVGLRAERRRRAGEQLGLRRHLSVNLQPDDNFPRACCAFDAIIAHVAPSLCPCAVANHTSARVSLWQRKCKMAGGATDASQILPADSSRRMMATISRAHTSQLRRFS
jgi:hypothetical protein